ncbi:MAG: DNA-directed RNA polymerase subunit omega [Lachnospiraceae bacterium]|nr:DNA-directed RNA polymerase subunit omega [Lachnospiraceae bacterium]
MLHPSYTDLINAVNADVEPGEQPVVQSRYSIVIATAKRARQLVDGAEAAVPSYGKKPLSIAIDEVYKKKIKIVNDDESSAD